MIVLEKSGASTTGGIAFGSMKLQKVCKDIRAEPDGKARNNSHNTRLHQNTRRL